MIKSRNRKTVQTSTILKAAVMATPAVLLVAQHAGAQPLPPAPASPAYWDINGTTAGASNTTSATGAWNGTNAFFNTAQAGDGSGTFLSDATGRTVVFHAGGNLVAAGNATGNSTITVTGTQNTDGLLFSGGTTTLSGGTVVLQGGATVAITALPSPTVFGRGTINSVIAGTNGLNLQYHGTNTGAALTLTAANTYSGDTTINNRFQLEVTNGSAFGTGTQVTFATGATNTVTQLRLSNVGTISGKTLNLIGAALRTGEAGFRNNAGNNTWAGNININSTIAAEGQGLAGIASAAGTTLTIDGVIANGTGNTWAKNSPGTLVLNQTNTYTGFVRIFDGMLVLNANGALGASGNSAGDFTGNTLMDNLNATSRVPIVAFNNNVNYTTYEAINMTSTGGAANATGRIDSIGGNNTFNGDIRLSTSVLHQINAQTGSSLTLNGRIWASSTGGRTFSKNGGGELIIRGDNNATDGFTLIGTVAAGMSQFAINGGVFNINEGQVTLKGANGTMNGGVAFNIGPNATLSLDNSDGVNLTRVSSVAPVGINGGTLKIVGDTTTAVDQTLSSMTVGSFSTIELSSPGASTTLTIPGALNRSARGTAIITGLNNTTTFMNLTGEPMFGNSGAAGTADINIATSAIVDTGSGTEFMTVGNGSGTGAARGLTSSEYTALTDGTTANQNTKSTLSQTVSTSGVADTTTVNSLKLEGNGTTVTIDPTSRIVGSISRAGRLQVDSGAILATGTGQVITGGDGTYGLNLGSYIEDPDFGELPSNSREGVIAVTQGADLTIGARIRSELGLTKTGRGTLVLTSTSSSYSGQTTINAGILGVSADGALGGAATPVVLNGGTFQISATTSLNASRGVQLASPVLNAIDVTSGNTATVNGVVSNGGSVASAVLTKVGPGTLVLTGSNTYSGGTNLNAGAVEVTTSANLGIGAVNFNGGDLRVPANATISNVLNVFNTNTTNGIIIPGGNEVVWSGLMNLGTPDTNFVIDGGGVFNPTANNNYASNTIVKGGSTLRYTVSQGQGNSAFGVQPGWYTLDNGTIQAIGQVTQGTGTNGLNNFTANKGVTLLAGGGTIDLQQGAATSLPYTVTISGVVTGSGNLTKIGTGNNNLVLAGANTNTGRFIIQQGKLTDAAGNAGLGANPALPTANHVEIASGATLGFSAAADVHANKGIQLLGGTPVIDVGGSTVTLAGVISESTAANLTRAGTGILVLEGNSTYTGSTNIVGGGSSNSSLRIATDNALPITTTVNLNAISATGLAVLDVRGGNQEIAGIVNSGGVGTVRLTNGTGTTRTLTLNNAVSNSWNGEITGSLAFTKQGVGSLLLNGSLTNTGDYSLQAGTTTIDTTAAGNTTIAGVIGGTGNLTKSGTGDLSVSHLNVNDVVVGPGGNLLVRERGASPLNANNRGVFLNSFSIDAAQALDYADHDLVVNGMAFTDVKAAVFAGFGNTLGLISSESNAAGGATILALFDNAQVGATDWLGTPIGANATVGKYTYFGDANIDGQVTGDDYGVVDANLNTTPAVGLEWLSGDMNLDGSVTGDDYGVIDANLGLGTSDPLSPAARLSALDGAAVPEPGSIGLLTAAGAGMLLRRRRTK